MARHRTRMPLGRGKPVPERSRAGILDGVLDLAHLAQGALKGGLQQLGLLRGPRRRADASFFEPATGAWRPRPDSPEVSVFTPEEEAESDRRWRQAVLRQKLRGPVTGAEQLGVGLSAAALAALTELERRPRTADGTGDGGRDAIGVGNVGGGSAAAAARKPAAGWQADKAPITSKAAGPMHSVVDSGSDVQVSNSVASRPAADSSAGGRRAAPRGSGGGPPPESRASGGGERADAGTTLRKPEQASADGRAPVFSEAAAVVRAPMEVEVAAVAIALRSDLTELGREIRDGGDAKGANAAKVDHARVPAEASGPAKAKDGAAPVAESKQDGRGVPAEALAREKGGDAPVLAEKSVEQGRGAEELRAGRRTGPGKGRRDHRIGRRQGPRRGRIAGTGQGEIRRGRRGRVRFGRQACQTGGGEGQGGRGRRGQGCRADQVHGRRPRAVEDQGRAGGRRDEGRRHPDPGRGARANAGESRPDRGRNRGRCAARLGGGGGSDGGGARPSQREGRCGRREGGCRAGAG